MVSSIENIGFPKIGRLNRRVIIRKRTDIASTSGGLDSTFTESCRWVEIVPVGSSIYLQGLQIGTSITHRIKLRYDGSITADHEVVHGHIVYRVHRCTDIGGEGRFTLLEVEELNQGESYYG